jgi:MFS family permease
MERQLTPFIHLFSIISRKRLLFTAALMVFFWAVFDSFVSYFTPILITDRGFSNAQMGLIYASSSIFGAIFDFVLAKVIKKAHYRRRFLLLFLVCAGYPMILWGAQTALVFVFAMMLWGLYYDLFSFASFDFISKESPKEHHASSFGTIGVFKSMGYLVGPLVAGGLASGVMNFGASNLSLFFLFISFIFLIALILLGREESSHEVHHHESPPDEAMSMHEEAFLWYRVWRRIVPVIIFTMLVYFFDAIYWTIGPLLSEDFPSFSDFGGLFIVAATVPSLITVWLVGNISGKFGKKRTAYSTFFVSCLVLFAVGFVGNPYAVLLLVFVSSLLSSIAYPSLLGTFADYLKESKRYDNEIIGVEDVAVNIGYVVGPIVAGVLSGIAGNLMTFSYVAIFGAVVVAVLFFVTPREIDFHDRSVERA